MPDIKKSRQPAIWIQGADNKLNIIKQYHVFYRGEEIGVVIDYDKGLMDTIRELSAEIKIEEI